MLSKLNNNRFKKNPKNKLLLFNKINQKMIIRGNAADKILIYIEIFSKYFNFKISNGILTTAENI